MSADLPSVPPKDEKPATERRFGAEFRDGMRDGFPVLVGAMPFAALFGTVAIDQGLTPSETMLLTATVFAGASQFVVIGLWADPMPVIAILFSVFAVNFRHLLYSVALGRHMRAFPWWKQGAAYFFLTDPQYAASEQRARAEGLTLTYYFTMALFLYGGWVAATWAGVVFGKLIEDPRVIGLDYTLTLYFLAIAMGFRARANWLGVVLISASVALIVHALVGAPYHIATGGLAGIIFAALRGKPPEGPAMEPSDAKVVS